jgi:hypothetical protein
MDFFVFVTKIQILTGIMHAVFLLTAFIVYGEESKLNSPKTFYRYFWSELQKIKCLKGGSKICCLIRSTVSIISEDSSFRFLWGVVTPRIIYRGITLYDGNRL